MATTSDYLTQLQADKQALVDNLVAKGVQATNNETFTTLVPKVNNIQSGGGDLSEYFSNTITYGSSSIAGYVKAIKKMPAFEIEGTSCARMFHNYYGTSIDTSRFNTSNVTQMEYMFNGCSNLTSLDLSRFNTSNVTTMEQMFRGCSSLTSLDLSNFNTSKVVRIIGIFYGCTNLKTLNLSNWDLSKITNTQNNGMYPMFNNCTNLTNLTFGNNLGAGYLTTANANNNNYKVDVSTCTKLTETSLISLLNGLADIASRGVQSQQCVLGATNLAKLTSQAGQQALAQAQAYGWTVS